MPCKIENMSNCNLYWRILIGALKFFTSDLVMPTFSWPFASSFINLNDLVAPKSTLPNAIMNYWWPNASFWLAFKKWDSGQVVKIWFRSSTNVQMKYICSVLESQHHVSRKPTTLNSLLRSLNIIRAIYTIICSRISKALVAILHISGW